jgi:hypothetical protein
MRRFGVTSNKAITDALSTLRLFGVVEGRSGDYRFVNEAFVKMVHRSRDVAREIDELRRDMEIQT